MSLLISNIKGQTKKGYDFIVVTREELSEFYSHNSNEQDRFKCPFCEQRGHNFHPEAKLFMDQIKGIGFCQVCQIVVSYNEGYSLETETLNFQRKFIAKEKSEQWFNISSWTIPVIESKMGMEYMDTRPVPPTKEILERFGVRFGSVNDKPVLVFPNTPREDGLVNCFQYKVLDPHWDGPKYITIGVPPIFWLDQIFDPPWESEINFVEGVFDALALPYGGCPILGSTLSELQRKQLREFCLIHSERIISINLILDGGVEVTGNKQGKEYLADYIKSIAGDIPIKVYHLPLIKGKGMDPEELMACDKQVQAELLEKVEVIQ